MSNSLYDHLGQLSLLCFKDDEVLLKSLKKQYNSEEQLVSFLLLLETLDRLELV